MDLLGLEHEGARSNYSDESISGVRDVNYEKLPAKYLIFIKLLAKDLYEFEDKKPFCRLSFSLVDYCDCM